MELERFEKMREMAERDFDTFGGYALERYFFWKFIEDSDYTKMGAWWNRKGEESPYPSGCPRCDSFAIALPWLAAGGQVPRTSRTGNGTRLRLVPVSRKSRTAAATAAASFSGLRSRMSIGSG